MNPTQGQAGETAHPSRVRLVPGMLVTVRGFVCRVVNIHPAGTIDVSTRDGKRHFRVSGLELHPCGHLYHCPEVQP